MSLWRSIPPLTVACIALAGCPNPLRETLEKVVEVYSTPLATVSPAGGSGIARTTLIVITFSETIQTASLTVAGTMALESDGGRWSTSRAPNDTLTISPQTGSWTPESALYLLVTCEDLEGYPIEPLALTFSVLNGVVYVSDSAGDDANPGIMTAPKKTIQPAIDLAAQYYATAEVRVAAGVYSVNFQQGTHVTLRPGISLLGGYSVIDWSGPDPETNLTKIWDRSNQPSADKSRAVDCGSNLTNATAVDGFTIEGGGGTGVVSCGIFGDASSPAIRDCHIIGGIGDSSVALRIVNGSPLIENCLITGGTGGSESIGVFLGDSTAIVQNNAIDGGRGSASYGIFCQGGSPTIEGNLIQGSQTGTQPDKSTGLALISSDASVNRNTIDGGFGYEYAVGVDIAGGTQAVLRNNLIYGGSGPVGVQSNTFGMFIDTCAAVVQNNTISSGDPGSSSPDASMSVAIVISNCTPIIENNIVFTSGGNDRIGIWEYSGGPPASFNNNDVYNCPLCLYWSSDLTFHFDFATINGYDWADANISVDPLFADLDGADNNIRTMADNDWHLTAASPISVRQGGLSLSEFSIDLDEATRTTPWSIGAYEQN